MGTELLSDYNIAERASIIVSKRKGYADLDLSLIPHPNKKDIIPLTDIDAVRNSIRNLVMTSPYERPFQPELGSRVKSLLFENADSTTSYLLRSYIFDIIEQYEPRVSEVVVEVQDDSDNNGYHVTITFNVISISVRSEAQIFLERIR